MVVPVCHASPGVFEPLEFPMGGTTPTPTPRHVGFTRHTKLRISPVGLPVLFPALSIISMFGGEEHAPRSSRLLGSVSSSILVHNWAIIVLCCNPYNS